MEQTVEDAGRPSKRDVLLPLAAVLTVAAFYIAASIVARIFPADGLERNLGTVKDASTVFDLLLLWTAAAVCSAAAAAAVFIFSGFSLWQQRASRNLSFSLVLALSILSIGLLICSGNATFDNFRNTICLPVTAGKAVAGPVALFCTPHNVSKHDMEMEGAPNANSPGRSEAGSAKNHSSLAQFIGGVKTILNAAFQLAAIAVITAFLVFSGPAANMLGNSVRRTRLLFYLASLVLSLIVLTDALYFDMVSSIVDSKSAMVGYQRGMLFYFAVTSSMTLVLALVAAVVLGGNMDILTARKLADGPANRNIGAFLFGIIANHRAAKTVATLAPILAAILTTALGDKPG